MFSIILFALLGLAYFAIVAVSKFLMAIVKDIAAMDSEHGFVRFMRKVKYRHVFVMVAALTLVAFGGTPINVRYGYYYRTAFGVRYADSWFPLPLSARGGGYYLKDANYWKIKVLSKEFAKDGKHVWYRERYVSGADEPSFYVDKSGLAKDKFHIFGYGKYSEQGRRVDYGPIASDVDVASAEYFVKSSYESRFQEYDDDFIRDKNHVYLKGKRISVDRNTFAYFDGYYYYDKTFIYYLRDRENIVKVDSLRCKPSELKCCYTYLKNGNSVAYKDSIIIRNEPIRVLELLDSRNDQCNINGRLYEWGRYVGRAE